MMIFDQDRGKIRQLYIDVWAKYRGRLPLEAMEQTIVNVIREHPEYHAILEDKHAALEGDYTPELGQSNPFLHMGLHIALHEQLSTDRPQGIGAVQQALLARLGDPHEVEHRMAECLGEVLWQAQRNGTVPDEGTYLACLWRLAGKKF